MTRPKKAHVRLRAAAALAAVAALSATTATAQTPPRPEPKPEAVTSPTALLPESATERADRDGTDSDAEGDGNAEDDGETRAIPPRPERKCGDSMPGGALAIRESGQGTGTASAYGTATQRFADTLYPEALRALPPEGERGARGRALADLARALSGKAPGATPHFRVPPLCRHADSPLWALVLAEARGNDELTMSLSDAAMRQLASAPAAHAAHAALAGAEAALRLDRPEKARDFVNALENIGPTSERQTWLYRIRGDLAEASGDATGAEFFWEQAVESDGLAKMRANRHAMAAYLSLADLRMDAAVRERRQDGPEWRAPVERLDAELDSLAYDWRGTALEPDVLKARQRAKALLGKRQEFLESLWRAWRRADGQPEGRAHLSKPDMAAKAADSLHALLVRGESEVADGISELALFERYGQIAQGDPRYAEIANAAAELFLDADLPERAVSAADQALSESLKRGFDDKAQTARRSLAIGYALSGRHARARRQADLLDMASRKDRMVAAFAAEKRGDLLAAASALDAIPEGETTVNDKARRADLLWRAEAWPAAARAYSRLSRALAAADGGSESIQDSVLRNLAASYRANNPLPSVGDAIPDGADDKTADRLRGVAALRALVADAQGSGPPSDPEAVQSAFRAASEVTALAELVSRNGVGAEETGN